MSKFPHLKARQVIQVVERLGFHFRGQAGSHAVYTHTDGRKTTIPVHPSQEIGIGLLTKIIKQDLQISREEFLRVHKKRSN